VQILLTILCFHAVQGNDVKAWFIKMAGAIHIKPGAGINGFY
jgi:hypothetical protein